MSAPWKPPPARYEYRIQERPDGWWWHYFVTFNHGIATMSEAGRFAHSRKAAERKGSKLCAKWEADLARRSERAGHAR